MNIAIRVQNIKLTAELYDNPTAKSIAAAFPIEGKAHVWGKEIYFEIPVDVPMADDAVQEVEIGTLAYWPAGSAFCIFFGPTPISTNDKPRAYSPVNVFGRINGDTAALESVPEGAYLSISGLI